MSRRGRPNRRGRGRPKPAQRHFRALLSPSELLQLLNEDVSEVVNDLSREIKWFQESLKSPELCRKNVDLILKLLHKISEGLELGGDISANAVSILGEAFSDRCSNFTVKLKEYISSGMVDPSCKPILTLACDLFTVLMTKLPATYWNLLPISELSETVDALKKDDEILDEENSLERKRNALVMLYQSFRNQKKVEQIRPVVAGQKEWDNSEYREVQILPQWDEIKTPKPPYRLRPNIVGKEEYKDWMHYFDVQFRLLREDFISPLRKGIREYHEGKMGRSLSNLRVYNEVWILRPVFTQAGLCHEIQFNTAQFFRCNWEHTKRLIFGSLLCLSPDNFFHKVLFATVTDRDPRKLARGRVQVMFQDGAEVILHQNKKTKFVMVESVAFFEASRHILRSLQKAEESTMPFTKYLIKNDNEVINPPKYLARRTRLTPYDLSLIVKKELIDKMPMLNKYSAMNIQNESSWPALEDTQLDESQLLAMKMALKQEISVIQGPPGTGKTYIGLKIVKALLNNFEIWGSRGLQEIYEDNASLRSPILVMCFTNHALDQFLEGIMDLAEDKKLNLIRVGGRSKNESLQNCNLNSVKRKLRNVPKSEYQQMKALRSKAEQIGAQCSFKLHNYKDYAHEFVSFTNLKHIISEHHIQSLFEQAESKEEREHIIELWLGIHEKLVHEMLVPIEEQDEQEESYSEESESGSEMETSSSDLELEDSLKHDYKEEVMQVETIAVVGEGTQEEDARIIGDTVELFKELNLDNISIRRKPKKPKRTHNIRRIVKVQECENAHFYLQSRMRNVTTSLDENEAEAIDDLYQLTLNQRWEMYKYWHFKYRSELMKDLERECMHYNDACAEVQGVKKGNERYALETAHVIGMTTTGAAKYQHILHMLKPRIVIVEEAAEVLESHIVSALNAGTQQLILIGDHKQLRPKPNAYDLAVKYNLDISLFERLVKKGFPHATLENQHRMRPEIAELVRPHIYETLYNHKVVESYPHIKGVGSDLFLISHTEPEQGSNDQSHSNLHEARYLIALCRYLLQHDYKPSQITILVTYTGQLLLMKNEMPKSEFEGVRLTTVDNYQGEENDIILLSLVRSNAAGVIGFLKEENRVCVSLSRAKHGFYCIGNFKLLMEKSDVWKKIVEDMDSKKRVGSGLPIHCTNHPENKYIAKTPSNFAENSPRGGCKLDCGKRLNCGHSCQNKCHTSDPDHLKYICCKPCSRVCSLGHKCQKRCHEDCQCFEWVFKKFPDCDHELEIMCYKDISEYECNEMVEKTMPGCYHKQEMLCCKDPHDVLCKTIVEKTLKCKHKYEMPCHQDSTKYLCQTIVSKVLPLCGHTNTMPCYKSEKNMMFVACSSQCDHCCPKGHQCRAKCHKTTSCLPCNYEVEATLPKCKHKQTILCHEDPLEVECMSKCEKKCEHGHPCPLYCHETCQECEVRVQVKSECGHVTAVKCFMVDQFQCAVKVEKTLKCGHTVLAQCSKSFQSIYCDQMVETVLKRCGHKQSVLCSADPDTVICKAMVEVSLECTHTAVVQCSTSASSVKCMKMCTKTLKCKHDKILCCHADPDNERCLVLVQKTMTCGHSVKVSCYKEVSSADCTVMCLKELRCNHTIKAPCNKDINTIPCEVLVTKKMKFCSHTIQALCFQADLLSDMACMKTCNRILDCRHKCTRGCNEECVCSHKCEKKLPCGHNCRNLCSERCTTKCRFMVVKDYPCGHKHRLPCYMPIKDAPCDMICRAMLACGHLCQGQCSDCNSSRIHQPCTSTVGVRHYCGEQTRLPCCGIKDHHPSSKEQVIQCSHTSIPWKCSDPLPQCQEPCQWACECKQPKKCGKVCHEMCSREPCNEICLKRLSCGHLCVGLCGEPCVTLCPYCNPEDFSKQHKLSKPFMFGDRYVQLPCGHIFTVSYMDEFIRKPKSEVKPLQCPVCYSPLSTSYRYGNLTKESLRQVEGIRTDILENSPNNNEHLLQMHRDIIQSKPWLDKVNIPYVNLCLSLIQKNERFIVTWSPERKFLLSIFAKVLEGFYPAVITHRIRSIVDNFCDQLFHLLMKSTLSFQVISDLLSELFRITLEMKITDLLTGDVKETRDLLFAFSDDSKLRMSVERFSYHFKIISQIRRRRLLSYKSIESFLSDIEVFVPIVRNGTWKRCRKGHYYCAPVCRLDSLQIQCAQCRGK